jgi:glycine cleavage system regulatory protein
VFVNRRMLFKVEVTDANLYRNWRGYTVKKVSDDQDIINRFTELHGINAIHIHLLAFHCHLIFFYYKQRYLLGTNCHN